MALSRRDFHGLMLAQAAVLAGGPVMAANGTISDPARHPFLMTGQADRRKAQQSLFLVRGGKVVWSHSIPSRNANNEENELGDATLLPNGNVMFGRLTGASEITADKKTVWNIDAPEGTQIHSLQPVGADHVMVVQNGNPAKIMIINKATSAVEKTVIVPVPYPDKPHLQFRRVRMTPQGTFVAGHLDDHKVVEYDQDGNSIWSYPAARPWGLQRLKNGNTLISNATTATDVIEVTPAGKVVWRFSQGDVPEWRCFEFQGVARMANGNTLITNWCVKDVKDVAQWAGTAQVFEVTPAKKIVWALSQWADPDLGPGSMIQLLDQPGGYGVGA
jgi:hypothetical protein